MPETLGEAVLKLSTDNKALDRGLRKAFKGSQRLQKSFNRIGKSLTLKLTAPILAVAGAGVKLASDLNESLSKAGEVFKDSAQDIINFADTSATQFGITRQEALEYSGTLGTILQASGLAEQASADMSIQMVKLSADLASFNNIPIAVALNKIRSGLVGEVEPLRTVGVLLNAAAVETKALELGLVAAGEELTEAAKVQARLALITEQTATAQGDFQRTSDQLANSSRILKAELKDVAATFFTALIPAAQTAIQFVRGLVDWFKNLSPEMKNTILIIAGVAAALGPLLLGLGLLAKAFGVAIVAIKAAGIALMFLQANPIAAVITAVVLLTTLIIANWDTIARVTENLYLAVKKWLQDKLGAVFAWVGNAVEKVTGFFGEMFDKVAGGSFVPEMIDEIERQFRRLDSVMVRPAEVAAGEVVNIFRNMADNIKFEIADVLTALAMGEKVSAKGVKRSLLSGIFRGLVAFGTAALVTALTGGNVAAGLGAGTAVAGSFAAQRGFHGVIRRPTIGVFGEGFRAERVDISPISNGAGAAQAAIPGGGITIAVTVQSSVIANRQTVRELLEPPLVDLAQKLQSRLRLRQ